MTETTTDPETQDLSEPEKVDQPDAAGSEAAKYRKRLRATEAERDALAAKLEGHQRREAERILAEHVTTPADVWMARPEALAGLLDDEGQVDADRVADLAVDVLEGHPGWKLTPRPTGRDFDAGVRPPAPAAPSWSGVLRGE
jgi:hypothetical protein